MEQENGQEAGRCLLHVPFVVTLFIGNYFLHLVSALNQLIGIGTGIGFEKN